MEFDTINIQNRNPNLFLPPRENKSFILSKYWLFLAIISLSFSGFFAFFITVARTPYVYELFHNPDFFKKALVIHVNLGFLIWLSCFVVSIFYLISNNNKKKILTLWISIIGILLITIPSLFLEGKGILSNYVPMIDHSVFLIGIFLFTSGIFLALLDKNLFHAKAQNSILQANTVIWIKASAISFIVAFESGIFSYLLTPKNFDPKTYYEILYWAPGHIFVFSIEALKIALWFAILNLLFPENQFFKNHKLVKISGILYSIIPLVSLFFFSYNTFSNEFRNNYTQLMRWGIFPFSVFLILMIFFHLYKDKIVLNIKINKYFLYSIYFSIFMTILGYILGAFIQVPNTMVPAHYHASIGSITLILMVFSIILFDYFGFPVKTLLDKNRLFLFQPLIYAIGQSIFAIGFGLAGINGQGRKLFAKEQEIRGILDYLGLGLLGIGGIIAIFAGILFISIFFYCIKYELSIKFNVLILNIKTTIKTIKEVPYGKKTSHTKVHG
jgi:hypothetical protein